MITDVKKAIWEVLHNEITRLSALYPDKVNAKVVTVYPKTVSEIDTKDIITIARVSSPQEDKFLGDIMNQQLNTATERIVSKFGALEQDHWEIAIWSLNPQRRDQLYLLVRQILFEKKHEELLGKYKLIRFFRISGSDSDIDVTKSGRTIYQARLGYVSQTQTTYGTTDELVEAFEVYGHFQFGDAFDPSVVTTYTRVPSAHVL